MVVMIIVVMMHSQQGPFTPHPPQNSVLEDDEHLVAFLFYSFQIDRLRRFLNVNYLIIPFWKFLLILCTPMAIDSNEIEKPNLLK